MCVISDSNYVWDSDGQVTYADAQRRAHRKGRNTFCSVSSVICIVLFASRHACHTLGGSAVDGRPLSTPLFSLFILPLTALK